MSRVLRNYSLVDRRTGSKYTDIPADTIYDKNFDLPKGLSITWEEVIFWRRKDLPFMFFESPQFLPRALFFFRGGYAEIRVIYSPIPNNWRKESECPKDSVTVRVIFTGSVCEITHIQRVISYHLLYGHVWGVENDLNPKPVNFLEKICRKAKIYFAKRRLSRQKRKCF